MSVPVQNQGYHSKIVSDLDQISEESRVNYGNLRNHIDYAHQKLTELNQQDQSFFKVRDLLDGNENEPRQTHLGSAVLELSKTDSGIKPYKTENGAENIYMLDYEDPDRQEKLDKAALHVKHHPPSYNQR